MKTEMKITRIAGEREAYDVLSASGKIYHVTYRGSGDADPEYVAIWSCTCPGAGFRGTCKHIDAVTAMADAAAE